MCIFVLSWRITAFTLSPKAPRKASEASIPLLNFVSMASASASVSPTEAITCSLCARCASTARRLPTIITAQTADATAPPTKKPTKSIVMPPSILNPFFIDVGINKIIIYINIYDGVKNRSFLFDGFSEATPLSAAFYLGETNPGNINTKINDPPFTAPRNSLIEESPICRGVVHPTVL